MVEGVRKELRILGQPGRCRLRHAISAATSSWSHSLSRTSVPPKKDRRSSCLLIWFNSSNQDLVLVAITSQIGDDPRSVLLDEADFAGGKLPKRSMVKLAKVFTIHSALIGKRICAITESKLERDFEDHPRILFLSLSEP